MPFYKNWGFALVAIWFATFFVNWAVYGGDPFGLVFLEFAATIAWLVAWAGWSLSVRLRRKGRAKVDQPDQIPVHLWIVTGLAVIWHGSAAVAYVVRQTGSGVIAVDPHRAPVASYPAWIEAASAWGVWGGLAASLLLAVHSRYAVPAFGSSVAGLLVEAVYVRALWPTFDAQNFVAFQNLAVAMLFLFYVWRMRLRELLR